MFTRETLASLYKNISDNSLVGRMPCQQYYGNGLQVILLPNPSGTQAEPEQNPSAT